MDMQHLMLVGRATADSELLKAKSEQGKKFAVFTLVANRYLGKEKKDEATFYDCIVFGATAEKLVDKVKKGDRVTVTGRPEAEAYINKDGHAVGKIKVIVKNWEAVK